VEKPRDYLTPPANVPPTLEPLKESHEADQVEADLKAIFIEAFQDRA
jgi:hypothetical protein